MCRLHGFHGLCIKRPVGFIRTSHHQPGFQPVITRFRQLRALITVGRRIDQRAELLRKGRICRVPYQTVICHAIPGQHCIEQLPVMVQSKALVPGCAVLNIVQQAAGIVAQFM